MFILYVFPVFFIRTFMLVHALSFHMVLLFMATPSTSMCHLIYLDRSSLCRFGFKIFVDFCFLCSFPLLLLLIMEIAPSWIDNTLTCPNYLCLNEKLQNFCLWFSVPFQWKSEVSSSQDSKSTKHHSWTDSVIYQWKIGRYKSWLFLTDWFIDWMIEWLLNWLTHWLAGWLTDDLAERLADGVTICLVSVCLASCLLNNWQAYMYQLMTGALSDLLADWLMVWLTEWLTDVLAGWITGSSVVWLANCGLTGFFIHWLTDLLVC